MEKVKIKVWKENEEVQLPKYGKDGDACADVYATAIEWDETKDAYVIHTGLHFALPEDYEMQIRPRSSNTKTNLYMPNTPGTLDRGYRGELLLVYKRRTDSNVIAALRQIANLFKYTEAANRTHNMIPVLGKHIGLLNEECPYKVGDRIGQVIVYKRQPIEWEEIKEEADLGKTERGAGGFGSTGK